jgi:tRNA(Ile)-lysidine synthase
MPLDFEDKLARYIKKERLFNPGERVLLAVSGGADSTALLYALCSLKQKKIIPADFLCAHINHQLRGIDSDNDERFVIEQAGRLNLPAVAKKVNVRSFAEKHKLSIETAARQLRIDALIDIAQKNNLQIIATAHQADDNAETVIHRILRGTGFRGLAGIKPKNILRGSITFVRPLLAFTKKQITDYLKEQGLNWQTDATNFDCRHKRNFIRHRLLPELQMQSNVPIVEQLAKLSHAAQKFQSSLDASTQQLWPKTASCQKKPACPETGSAGRSVSLNINIFSQQHPAVKTELIHKALTSLDCPEKNLTHRHYERILQLSQSAGSNKKIALPAFFSVRREYTRLIFEIEDPPSFWRKPSVLPTAAGPPSEKIDVAVPSKIQAGSLLIETALINAADRQMENFKKSKTAYIERFDFDKIALPIIIRRKTNGDKFHPLGLPAEKKVGKFLTDQKIPQTARQKILIVSDKRKIIWVWPVRISEPVKVTSQTKKILQIQITDAQTAG